MEQMLGFFIGKISDFLGMLAGFQIVSGISFLSLVLAFLVFNLLIVNFVLRAK